MDHDGSQFKIFAKIIYMIFKQLTVVNVIGEVQNDELL